MPISYPSDDISKSAALPAGYEYKTGSNGALELWKTSVTPHLLITSNAERYMIVNGSLQTSLNTLYLEQAHSISSAGEDVVFKNLQSGILFNPIWAPVSSDGNMDADPVYFMWSTPVTTYHPNGTSATSQTITSTYDAVFPFNAGIFGLTYKIGQGYSGIATLEIKNQTGGLIFRKNLPAATYADGDNLHFGETFIRMFNGQNLVIGVYKEDGTLLTLRTGTSPSEPWRKADVREFVERDVLYADASGKLDASRMPDLNTTETGIVVNKADLYVLPVSTKFRIYTVTSESRIYYLNASADPTVPANWIAGGSTATSVTAFKGRTGNVVPTQGDYSADMVGAYELSVVDDGLRRVLSGQHLMLEAIGTSLTDNSTTMPAATSLTNALNAVQTTQGSSIGTLQTTVASQGSSIGTLQTTQASQGTAIGTLQSTQTSQGSSIGTLQTTVASQGTSIGTLQSTQTSQGSTLSTLQSTVSTQGTSIGTLQSIQTSQGASIGALQATTPTTYSKPSAYATGARVWQYGNLYEANGPVPANTAFALGTSGATWKLLVGTPVGSIINWDGGRIGLTTPDGYWPCDGTTITGTVSCIEGVTTLDTRNKVLANVSGLHPSGTSVGVESSNIARNQLPNDTVGGGSINYTPAGTVTTTSAGAHTHGIPSRTGAGALNTITTTTGITSNALLTVSDGAHTHPATFSGTPATLTVPTFGLNGGVTQVALSNMQPTTYVTQLIKL